MIIQRFTLSEIFIFSRSLRCVVGGARIYPSFVSSVSLFEQLIDITIRLPIIAYEYDVIRNIADFRESYVVMVWESFLAAILVCDLWALPAYFCSSRWLQSNIRVSRKIIGRTFLFEDEHLRDYLSSVMGTLFHRMRPILSFLRDPILASGF